jgi:hypothetical protein
MLQGIFLNKPLTYSIAILVLVSFSFAYTGSKRDMPLPSPGNAMYQTLEVGYSSRSTSSDSIFRRRPGGTSVVRCY